MILLYRRMMQPTLFDDQSLQSILPQHLKSPRQQHLNYRSICCNYYHLNNILNVCAWKQIEGNSNQDLWTFLLGLGSCFYLFPHLIIDDKLIKLSILPPLITTLHRQLKWEKKLTPYCWFCWKYWQCSFRHGLIQMIQFWISTKKHVVIW